MRIRFHLLRLLRGRIRGLSAIAAALLVVVYFVWHATLGDRGVMALDTLNQEIAAAERIRAELEQREARLQHHVSLVRPEQIDPEMLDELARRLLNVSRPDEIVVPLPAVDAP